MNDLDQKSADPPKQRVSFVIDEHYFVSFCRTAQENDPLAWRSRSSLLRQWVQIC